VILAAHVTRTQRSGADFLLGTTADSPFSTSYVRKRAREAWKAAELKPVTLRQLRHAHRSFLDAAGISEARADRVMGHARHTVGRRYTHQLRGQLAEDAARLDAYLNREAGVLVPFPTGAVSGAQAASGA
jgi:integrase